MQSPVVVTGASGVLGGAIVRAALDAGLPVRQALRNLAKAKPGAEAVRFDYTDPSSFPGALAGASGLVLIAPPLDPGAPAKLGPAITAAKDAGIGHIVFISAFGADHNEQAPLRIIEHLVIDSGVPYTILRPNFFMENFSAGFLAETIKNRNGIYLAAGDGKTSFISVRDIAAVVLEALRRPLLNQEFNLTGPAALDHAEVARIISEASGRSITYHALSEDEMVQGARAAGMPEPAADYLKALYAAVRAGFAAAVTDDVQKVLGRPPLTFEEFARAEAAAWK